MQHQRQVTRLGPHRIETGPVEHWRVDRILAMHIADRDSERVDIGRSEERRDRRRIGHLCIEQIDRQAIFLARQFAQLSLNGCAIRVRKRRHCGRPPLVLIKRQVRAVRHHTVDTRGERHAYVRLAGGVVQLDEHRCARRGCSHVLARRDQGGAAKLHRCRVQLHESRQPDRIHGTPHREGPLNVVDVECPDGTPNRPRLAQHVADRIRAARWRDHVRSGGDAALSLSPTHDARRPRKIVRRPDIAWEDHIRKAWCDRVGAAAPDRHAGAHAAEHVGTPHAEGLDGHVVGSDATLGDEETREGAQVANN
mmetsp:Transcript_52502/g.145211  ORF Transcript_52502/g.145211 Transcript_52502/m.145211 type:complete len:309 (+) Transcript_52502:347-1273(+)